MNEEIKLIDALLQSPAGFRISIYGLLEIEKTAPSEWTVRWEFYQNPHDNIKSEWDEKIFTSTIEAATFFCEMRQALYLGDDISNLNPTKEGYYQVSDKMKI